jgi:hypothetical protein
MAEDVDGRGGQRDWGGNTGSLGGYGSAGLFSRRRQMERTEGGSFLNQANAPRAAAVGGYVGMPTQGPTPEVTAPVFGKRQGPSGPSAMAPGVAGNYNVRPPQVPNWGQTTRLLAGLTGVAPFLRGQKGDDTGKDNEVPQDNDWAAPRAEDVRHGPINLGEDPFAGPDTDDWGRPLAQGNRPSNNWASPTGWAAPRAEDVRHGPIFVGDESGTPSAPTQRQSRVPGRPAPSGRGSLPNRPGGPRSGGGQQAPAAAPQQQAPAAPSWGAPTGVRFDPDALVDRPEDLFAPDTEDPFAGSPTGGVTPPRTDRMRPIRENLVERPEDLFAPDTEDPFAGSPTGGVTPPRTTPSTGGQAQSGGQPTIPLRSTSRPAPTGRGPLPNRPAPTGRGSLPRRPGGPRFPESAQQQAAVQQAAVQQTATSYEYPETAQPLSAGTVEDLFAPDDWSAMQSEQERMDANVSAMDAETALIRARNQAAQQSENQATSRGASSRSRSRGRRQIPGQQSFDL